MISAGTNGENGVENGTGGIETAAVVLGVFGVFVCVDGSGVWGWWGFCGCREAGRPYVTQSACACVFVVTVSVCVRGSEVRVVVAEARASEVSSSW